MMTQPIAKPILAERFKTKMCKNFEEQGACPYESRCMFAHGEHELRTKQMNLNDNLVTEEAIKAFQKAAHFPAPAANAASAGLTNGGAGAVAAATAGETSGKTKSRRRRGKPQPRRRSRRRGSNANGGGVLGTLPRRSHRFTDAELAEVACSPKFDEFLVDMSASGLLNDMTKGNLFRHDDDGEDDDGADFTDGSAYSSSCCDDDDCDSLDSHGELAPQMPMMRHEVAAGGHHQPRYEADGCDDFRPPALIVDPTQWTVDDAVFDRDDDLVSEVAEFHPAPTQADEPLNAHSLRAATRIRRRVSLPMEPIAVAGAAVAGESNSTPKSAAEGGQQIHLPSPNLPARSSRRVSIQPVTADGQQDPFAVSNGGHYLAADAAWTPQGSLSHSGWWAPCCSAQVARSQHGGRYCHDPYQATPLPSRRASLASSAGGAFASVNSPDPESDDDQGVFEMQMPRPRRRSMVPPVFATK